MENITSQQILSIITVALLLILVAPKVIRLNMARGTTLRNIALWLLAFVALMWAYQFIYPERMAQEAATTAEAPFEPTPMGKPIPTDSN